MGNQQFAALGDGSSSGKSSSKSQCINGSKAQVAVVLGAQWGDEGKGKLVDILAMRADVCGRFNGGANAGHTLVVDGQKFAFHLLPCGMINKKCLNVIGPGVVLHIPTMLKEIKELQAYDPDCLKRLFLQPRQLALRRASSDRRAAGG